jgi:hypothetical protein
MAGEFHRVRTHSWVNGVLKYLDHTFETFEDALFFANNYECDNFKIFDHDDRVKHSSHGKHTHGYA